MCIKCYNTQHAPLQVSTFEGYLIDAAFSIVMAAHTGDDLKVIEQTLLFSNLGDQLVAFSNDAMAVAKLQHKVTEWIAGQKLPSNLTDKPVPPEVEVVVAPQNAYPIVAHPDQTRLPS